MMSLFSFLLYILLTVTFLFSGYDFGSPVYNDFSQGKFAHFFQFFDTAVCIEQRADIGRSLESGAFGTDIVSNEHIEMFLFQFGSSVFDDIGRFCGKANEYLMRFALSQSIKDIRVLFQLQIQYVIIFLDFVLSRGC